MSAGTARIIRAVGKVPGVSGILRWFAGRYPEGSVVTIRSGYAQGMRWKRSHQYANGLWVGQHELDVQAAIVRLLSPGDTFLDLGASAGFFTIIAGRRVGPGGQCIAVDPDPFNCQHVRAQAELNGLSNCVVIEAAAAERAGSARFALSAPGESTGHLAGDAEPVASAVDVTTTTVDDICQALGRVALVKADVEGAEVRVLRGATRTLATIRPAWLMEVHSPELGREVRQIMRDAGYRFTTLAGEPLPESETLPHHSVALHSGLA
jgi:FkbM family methyltransferase